MWVFKKESYKRQITWHFNISHLHEVFSGFFSLFYQPFSESSVCKFHSVSHLRRAQHSDPGGEQAWVALAYEAGRQGEQACWVSQWWQSSGQPRVLSTLRLHRGTLLTAQQCEDWTSFKETFSLPSTFLFLVTMKGSHGEKHTCIAIHYVCARERFCRIF